MPEYATEALEWAKACGLAPLAAPFALAPTGPNAKNPVRVMLTDNILDLIGRTPLIRLKGESIFAKAEFLNPGGSIKDRVALAMIEGAERYFSTALM